MGGGGCCRTLEDGFGRCCGDGAGGCGFGVECILVFGFGFVGMGGGGIGEGGWVLGGEVMVLWICRYLRACGLGHCSS